MKSNFVLTHISFGKQRPLLTVNICGIERRTEKRDLLIKRLVSLIEILPDPSTVDLLIYVDNEEMTVGQKRNRLLEETSGEYIASVDDDDNVSDDYFIKILEAIKNNPGVDTVTFRGQRTHNGTSPQYIDYSAATSHKHHRNGPDAYYRQSNHLTPLKSSIAKKYKFPLVSWSEDERWINSILDAKEIKTEVHLKDVLYFYYFDESKSATYGKRTRSAKVIEITEEQRIEIDRSKPEAPVVVQKKKSHTKGCVFIAGKIYRVT